MRSRSDSLLYRVAEMYYQDHMTQKEIAEELFTSISNVSRILKGCRNSGIVTFDNNTPHISPRDKFLTQNLSRQNKIAFIIYLKSGNLLTREPLYFLMISMIRERIMEMGYIFEMDTLVDGIMIDDQIKTLESRGYLGALVFATEMQPEDIQRMQSVEFPCVFLDNNGYDFPVDCVMLATRKITTQIVNYLYEKGHRKFGYLRLKDSITARLEKERDFKEALASHNLTLDPRFIYSADFTPEQSYRQYAKQIHRSPDMPTAFFSDTDTLAYSAIKIFQQIGYRVPDDISVIGMDGRTICEQITPKITTAAIDTKAYTDLSLELLMKRIQEKHQNNSYRYPPIIIRIMTKIIERESVSSISP